MDVAERLTTRVCWNTGASCVHRVPGSGRHLALHDKKKQVSQKHRQILRSRTFSFSQPPPLFHASWTPVSLLAPLHTSKSRTAQAFTHSPPQQATSRCTTGQLGGQVPEQLLADLSTSAPSVPVSSPLEPGCAAPDHFQQPSSIKSLNGHFTPTLQTLTKFSPVGSYSGHRSRKPPTKPRPSTGCLPAALSGVASNFDTKAWTHLLWLSKRVLRHDRGGRQKKTNAPPTMCEGDVSSGLRKPVQPCDRNLEALVSGWRVTSLLGATPSRRPCSMNLQFSSPRP